MAVNLRLVQHVFALTFLITVADVCLFAALVLKPFSEDAAWRTACWTAEWFWGYMQSHWENNLNARPAIHVTGDEMPIGEAAVVISNHQSYADWYLVQHLALPRGMLGKCRYFVKKEIVWQIPLFGWAFWAIGMILVSRKWTNDSRLIEEAFGRIKKHKHDAWIVLYPEGTRCTSQKLLESQAWARRQNLQPLDHVLWPRTKGFIATIQGLRKSHIKYLYDLTFVYVSPGGSPRVPTLGEQLATRDLTEAGYSYHIDIRRVPIAELPTDEEELKSWAEDAWRRKDQLIGRIRDSARKRDQGASKLPANGKHVKHA